MKGLEALKEIKKDYIKANKPRLGISRLCAFDKIKFNIIEDELKAIDIIRKQKQLYGQKIIDEDGKDVYCLIVDKYKEITTKEDYILLAKVLNKENGNERH